MADEEDAYNNSHRAFLQAFLARSVLTFDEIKPILAAILSVHGTPPSPFPSPLHFPTLTPPPAQTAAPPSQTT